MSALVDLTDQKFGRRTVLGQAESKNGKRRWKTVCECGKEQVVIGADLKRRHSCGCYVVEYATNHNRRHGGARRGKMTQEYRAWKEAQDRCYRATSPFYHRYGGRGIGMCDRWRESFETFLADMGPKPSAQHSIDRVDNDGHYEPGNCRWATKKEQARNQSSNRLLTYQGETMPMAAWAERVGRSSSTVSARLQKGWTVERALTEPVRRQSNGRKSA
jgi:hypothetical protein